MKQVTEADYLPCRSLEGGKQEVPGHPVPEEHWEALPPASFIYSQYKILVHHRLLHLKQKETPLHRRFLPQPALPMGLGNELPTKPQHLGNRKVSVKDHGQIQSIVKGHLQRGGEQLMVFIP